MLAPIVLFVYNRPTHTKLVLNALMQSELADKSILHIYSDGPKYNMDSDQLSKIAKVREIIHNQKWCKEVIIIEQTFNKGLADSIIEGVTEIVNRYGKVIVMEDDIVISKGFLKYMNDALLFYENNQKVFHVSGFMYPHKESLPETFFYNVPLCWGWGTWKRAWSFFNPDTKQLLEYFDTRNEWNKFNKFGGLYLERQLRANATGELNTWFIKWHASILIQDGYTLYPRLSLVNNIGFDNTGVHNGTSDKFEHAAIADKISIHEIALVENRLAKNIVKNFYKNLGSNKNSLLGFIFDTFNKIIQIIIPSILKVVKEKP